MARRSTALSLYERARIARDLTDVGRIKMVGYLPLYTIRDFVLIDATDMVKRARRKGLATKVFRPHQCCIQSGAFHVYHRAALRGLLSSSAETVRASGLSTHPDQFIRQIAGTWFGLDDPVSAVIAMAFGGPIRRI